jgi:hypothetical protein
MDTLRRTSSLRRVAMTATLAALLVPAGQAEAATSRSKAKAPVVTSVTPMRAEVGKTLLIKGSHFRKGKGRNSVGFKADGAAVVFVKADISTTRRIYVKLPAKLEKVMVADAGAIKATRFHIRVLASRFGKRFTSNRLSPVISPGPQKAAAPGESAVTSDITAAPAGSAPAEAPAPAAPEGDCDADGTPNGVDGDDDNDLLADALENEIGTDGCKADSDGDTVPDGYEFRSAVDLNDDEYQTPNQTAAAPAKLGYPNALLEDAGVDYDGDGLSLTVEYQLWNTTTPAAAKTLADPGVVNGSLAATPLNYSDGLQYSKSERCPNVVGGNPALCGSATHDNRRVPSLKSLEDGQFANFVSWADAKGYLKVYLHDTSAWYDHQNGRVQYDIRDVNRKNGLEAGEQVTSDYDRDSYLDDGERDEDADGLSNLVELRGEMQPAYWTSCYSAELAYPVDYAGTSLLDGDTDGDGVRDGADDQDHDDVPNIMELSRMRASGFDDTDDGVIRPANPDGSQPPASTGGGRTCKPDEELDPKAKRHSGFYGQVNPFNPCEPDRNSRSCMKVFTFGSLPAPFDGPDWWSLQ